MNRFFRLTSISSIKNLISLSFLKRFYILLLPLFCFSCNMFEEMIGRGSVLQIEYSLRQPIESSYAVGDTVIIDMHLKSLDGPCQNLTLEENPLDETGYPLPGLKELDRIYYDPMVTEWDYHYEYVVDTLPSNYQMKLEVTPYRERQGNTQTGFGGTIDLIFTIE